MSARALIVEADGGSRGNPGPAAYGAVVVDAASGSVLAELAEYLGETTNNVAEYRGVIEGLRHAHEIDANSTVEVRADSKLVVEQMSGRWQVKSPSMRELAATARGIFPPGRVAYTWVPRDRNRRADALVNEMLDGIVTGGPEVIRRLDGVPAEDLNADDVVGSIDVEHNRALVEDKVTELPPAVMVGWADLARPTTTVLARHGATDMSVEKRFSGRGGLDLPLNEIGRAQARALAAEVAARGEFDRIVASPLLRAQQTAGIVAEAIGLEVVTDEGFAECAFGEWDGHTFAEVKQRWPEQLDDWLRSTEVAPPGGESFAQCRDRVNAARTSLIERAAGERVLIVAHVTPIKVLVSLAVDAPLRSIFRMELPPCSLTTLAWFPDGNASMFSFAEAAHTRAIVIPDGV